MSSLLRVATVRDLQQQLLQGDRWAGLFQGLAEDLAMLLLCRVPVASSAKLQLAGGQPLGQQSASIRQQITLLLQP